MKLSIITLKIMLLSITITNANNKFDVYYLCIGAGHYEQNSKKFDEIGFVPYDNLNEAIASAQIMNGIFKEYAEGDGILLTSTTKQPLTRKRILSSISSLVKMSKSSPNPFVIIYYCGHGISENFSWNQFLIPGDYTKVPGSKSMDELTEELIWIGDIADQLDRQDLRYMLLVDCCRKEGADISLPEKRLQYFFDNDVIDNFKEVTGILKYVNEYHQSNPVVFSINPGHSATVVSNPNKKLTIDWYNDTSVYLGPICRRSIIALQSKIVEDYCSLVYYIKLLTSSSLDRMSPTSVSFYESKKHDDESIMFRVIKEY